MAHENLNIDPVQGLIDYVNDIKPYHTKVIEALIEYIGVENIQVNFTEDFNLDIDFIFKFDGIFICVNGGLGGNAFDDPDTVPILSPDISKSVIEYPAFSNGFFIVLGDRTKLFDPTINLNFRVRSFFDDKLVDVTASSGSPETGGEFILIGDRVSSFPIGTIFNIVGSAKNDGAYFCTRDAFLGSVSGPTIIPVDGQKVHTENVEGFVRKVDPINTGSFVILSSTYNRSLLTPHTTVFINGISMVVPTLQDNNQRYVSLVDVEPLEYKKVLSHSNELKYLTGSPQTTPTQSPDEGVVHVAIVNISTSPASFSILGNYDISNIYVGDEFTISGSTGNDGTHVITSIDYHFDNDVLVNDYVTTFGVATANLFSIDGIFHINIPSNVFVVADNYTNFFVQGTKINVISGSKQGIYTTINSRFYNNSTYIRVIENIIREGTGRLIVATTGSPIDSIVVDGNLAPIYPQDQQFNIIRSLNNNGLYTTSADSIYDVNTNTTIIPIVEPFNQSDTTGEIVKFDKGSLTVLATGFGETPELCEIIPATLIHVNIREHLFFNGIQMHINENIIATGINSEQWGFELPATTVFRTTEPDVEFSDTAPTLPPPIDGDFWFDTSTNTGSPTGPGILKQYRDLLTVAPNTSGWLNIDLGKIYWIDTTTNYLYYRIINQYYYTTGSPPTSSYPSPTKQNGMDSDWVLELTFVPGMNVSVPGTDKREEIAYESFFAKESSTAVAGTRFSFAITGSPPTQNSIPTRLAGSPPVPVPNPTLLEVTVDGTNALVDIISTTEFEIISPRMHVGDMVEARIYDFTGIPTATYVGAWDANAAIEETFDMFLGYRFAVIGTDGTNNKIHIADNTGSIYNIFALGSPPDTFLEIENDINNNGTYTITNVAQVAGSPPTYTILTVLESLIDTGIFTTSPVVPTGNILYQNWFQYLVVNTTTNSIIVLNDATTDIINGMSIKIVFSGGGLNNGTYTVNSLPTYDGTKTTIFVLESLTPGEAGSWVESI